MSDVSVLRPVFQGTFLRLGLLSAALLAGCAAPTGGAEETAAAEAELGSDWVGKMSFAFGRDCSGVCEEMLRPAPAELAYDEGVRQRASVRVMTFEVYKEGVTTWDDPDRWQKLDVQVHTRVAGEEAFTSRYVPFDRRLGHNARYVIDLAQLDPLPGYVTVKDATDCPRAPLTADGSSFVSVAVELFVTVNGMELRPYGGGAYRVRYQNYRSLYAPCVD